MSNYELSDAVASLSHYSSATGTLWGIFAAATFTAAGFGIAMEEAFTRFIALFLTVGFVAFASGHLALVIHHVRVQQIIAAEILAHLGKTPSTGFPQSVAAICARQSRLDVSITAHLVIDACVVAIIWFIAR